MGHDVSHSVSSVLVLIFYGFVSVGFCLSSATATTQQQRRRQQQQQQQHDNNNNKNQSQPQSHIHDGDDADAGDDNETRQTECWLLAKTLPFLQSQAVSHSSLLVYMLLRASIASSTPLFALVVYVSLSVDLYFSATSTPTSTTTRTGSGMMMKKIGW